VLLAAGAWNQALPLRAPVVQLPLLLRSPALLSAAYPEPPLPPLTPTLLLLLLLLVKWQRPWPSHQRGYAVSAAEGSASPEAGGFQDDAAPPASNAPESSGKKKRDKSYFINKSRQSKFGGGFAKGQRSQVLMDISKVGSLEALESVIVRRAVAFDQDHVASAIAKLVALSDDAGGRSGPDASSMPSGPARMEALGRAQRLLVGLCSALLR